MKELIGPLVSAGALAFSIWLWGVTDTPFTLATMAFAACGFATVLVILHRVPR